VINWPMVAARLAEMIGYLTEAPKIWRCIRTLSAAQLAA
jgi:hypothetical protein